MYVHDIPVAHSMNFMQALLSRLANVVQKQFQVRLYMSDACVDGDGLQRQSLTDVQRLANEFSSMVES